MSDDTTAPVPFYKTRWFRRVVFVVLGAALGAACPFIPNPIVKSVCVAVTGVAHTLDTTPEEAPATDGGVDAVLSKGMERVQ